MDKKTAAAASVAALALSVAAAITIWRLRGRKSTDDPASEIDELERRILATLQDPASTEAQRLAKLLQRLSPDGVVYVEDQSIAVFLLRRLRELRQGELGDDEAIGFESLLDRLEEAADREGL